MRMSGIIIVNSVGLGDVCCCLEGIFLANFFLGALFRRFYAVLRGCSAQCLLVSSVYFSTPSFLRFLHICLFIFFSVSFLARMMKRRNLARFISSAVFSRN